MLLPYFASLDRLPPKNGCCFFCSELETARKEAAAAKEAVAHEMAIMRRQLASAQSAQAEAEKVRRAEHAGCSPLVLNEVDGGLGRSACSGHGACVTAGRRQQLSVQVLAPASLCSSMVRFRPSPFCL